MISFPIRCCFYNFFNLLLSEASEAWVTSSFVDEMDSSSITVSSILLLFCDQYIFNMPLMVTQNSALFAL